MALFRFQRGSYEESMETICEVHSIEELAKVVLQRMQADIDDVLTIRKCHKIDKRNNWNTYIVTLNGCAIGYTNALIGEEYLSYNLLGKTYGMLDYVQVVPKSLNDWTKLQDDLYCSKHDTQQLLYVIDGKYHVQRASVYHLINLKKITVVRI